MAAIAEVQEELPAQAGEEDQGSRKWWVLGAVGTGTFMSALDGSVVNTILPVLHRAFHGTVASVEWVVTVYLLVVSSLLLTFGRLGDLRGHKSVYVYGFVLFVIGSALCGLAPSEMSLVAFRGLQALGAAMLFANSPAILTTNFPARQRGQALGMLGTMTYLGLTTGPSLGGWLAGQFTWRDVFYINVPVGALALYLSIRFIPQRAPAERSIPFDRLGALLFMVGLVALLLALDQGHSWGWTSPLVLGLMGGAAAILALFLRIENCLKHPMLDLSLFRTRLFSAAAASAVLNYMCVSGAVFLLPFYLMQGRGLTPTQAGLVLTAQPVAMAILAPISGSLSDRIGSRIPGTLGMIILTAGVYSLSAIGAHTSMLHIAAWLAVAGVGSGMFVAPNNNALMGSAPRERQGIAGGILAIARNVGMVVGIGLAGAVYTSSLAHGNASSPATLFHAIHLSLLTTTGVAVAGIFTSAVRGSGGSAGTKND